MIMPRRRPLPLKRGGLGRGLPLLLLALGCAAPYPFKAAAGHAGLIFHRRNIEKTLKDPGTAPDVKTKLTLVLEARRFAFDVLHLKKSALFSTWTPVKGDYVT